MEVNESYGRNDEKNAFWRLLNIIKTLRAEDGCPWDREQTPFSMRTPLVEEAFEAVDAITQKDAGHAMEELGDVILNALMISYIYEQSGDFCVADVLNSVCDKLVRRHPHIFPPSETESLKTDSSSEFEPPGTGRESPDSRQVALNWEEIKEKVEGRKEKCVLDEVPKGFPPILRSFKYQKKAAKLGFEWQDISDVEAKVYEELKEVSDARKTLVQVQEESESGMQASKPPLVSSDIPVRNAQLHVEEEIGDLLFAVVNYARMLGVDPEVAMNGANEKFHRRFSYVQKKMEEKHIPCSSENLSEMDGFWKKAKEKGL